MICVVDAVADLGRYVVVHNMKQLFPAHETVYLSEADLSKMAVPKEWLYLLAHGDPNKVGSYTPAQLATELIAKGLKTGTRIEVRACSSGVPAALTQKTYVDALVEKITTRSGGKIIVYAQGYTGTGVIQENGSYLAKDDIKNDHLKQQAYKQILGSPEAIKEIADAELFVKNALAQKKSLAEIAEGVALRTQKTFKLLYAHNLTVTKLPEPSLSGTSLADYLKALDPQWLVPQSGGWTLDILEGISWQAVHEWSLTVPPSAQVYRVLSGEAQLH